LKIGLIICHCGTNIAGTIDIEYLKKYFSAKGVVVRDHKHACTDDGIKLIKELIREEGIDRLVIAACTPFLHGELFRKAAEEEGLNRGFVRIANIREHCSWPHYGFRTLATLKARDLIEMEIEASKHACRIGVMKLPVEKRILVIGGGVAGVMASLLAADMGFDVVLVEKSPVLGGNMAKLDKLFPTLDCAPCILGPLLYKVYNNDKIRIHTLSEVVEISGRPGDYRVVIKSKPRFVIESECSSGCTQCIDACPIQAPDEYNNGLSLKKAVWRPTPVSVPNAPYIDPELCIGCMSCVGVCDRNAIDFTQEEKVWEERVGAVIVCCGMKPHDPSKTLYSYGDCDCILTSLDYEWLLNSMGPTGGELTKPSGGKPESICFIQCVGSRSYKSNEYCSGVCCLNTLKLAVNTKLRYPDVKLTVFYTDIRAPGTYGEELYRRALELGVEFVRARIARVECTTNKARVCFDDTLTGNIECRDYDLAVLAVGIESSSDSRILSRILGLQVDSNGFIQPYHTKLYPSDTFVAGVYVAGACTGPKDISESVMQAGLAVARAAGFLSKGYVEIEENYARIDYEKCVKCGTCYAVCPFKAIKFKEGKPLVDPISCRGCGSCVASCPTEAISLPQYSIAEARAKLKALLENEGERAESPIIPAFVCRWCGYAALDNAGVSKIRYPTNIRPILVPCSIAVSPRLVLEAFEMGADGVLVIGCHDQDCHYRAGAPRFKVLAQRIKELLEKAGIDASRFEFIQTSAGEGYSLAQELREFVDRIKKLGPLGSEVEG